MTGLHGHTGPCSQRPLPPHQLAVPPPALALGKHSTGTWRMSAAESGLLARWPSLELTLTLPKPDTAQGGAGSKTLTFLTSEFPQKNAQCGSH